MVEVSVLVSGRYNRRNMLRGAGSKGEGQMSDGIDSLLGRVSAGIDASLQEMAGAIDAIMRGEWSPSQIGLLLTALHHKGETADEVAGAAQALRQHMTPIASPHAEFVDTCGTGGDGLHTFNISTASALVVAAAGIPVVKHGNRGITSKSGSADVLDRLGVNIEASVPQVQRCLEDAEICFCFAPLMHQSMKFVGPVRRELGFPTIFNMLGPLANPALAPYQLIGVGRPPLRPLLARAVAHLGTKRTVVVHGADGLDEVSLAGPTAVSVVEGDAVDEQTWQPSDFGLDPVPVAELVVDGPAASCRAIRDVLGGCPGPMRDVVVLNAAAALWTVGVDDSLQACATRAAAAIDEGKADATLQQLAVLSHAPVA